MQKGCTVDDYAVTIGRGKCENLQLKTNSLQCRLPRKAPEPDPDSSSTSSLSVTVCYQVSFIYTIIKQANSVTC